MVQTDQVGQKGVEVKEHYILVAYIKDSPIIFKGEHIESVIKELKDYKERIK